MTFEVDMRFDVNLSIKQTQRGPQAFKIAVGIKMMAGETGTNRRWRQLDTPDFRIPAHGSWDWLNESEGIVVMKGDTGDGFARLDGFKEPPVPGSRGLARVYRPGTRTYNGAAIEWHATGTWTILEGRRKNLPEISPGFFSRWWENIQQMNMQTDWQYDTCAGWSVSAGAKYGGEYLQGDIWLRDTHRRANGPRYRMHYWGLGAGVMTKGAGGAFSTASMPSIAVSGDYVRRGPAAVNDPLQPSDFEGACHILDCGAGGTGLPIVLPKVGKLPYGKGGLMTNLMIINFGVTAGVWLGASRAWMCIWTPVTIAGSVKAGGSASATLNIGKVTVTADP